MHDLRTLLDHRQVLEKAETGARRPTKETMSTKHIPAYPLAWPQGWERSASWQIKKSRFKVSQEKATQDLLRNVKLLGGRDVVISTNVELRRDGLPYANRPKPKDAGVAVYWTRWDKGRVLTEVMACDAYPTVGENIRAICVSIDAVRQIERARATQILNRVYMGFAALPPSGAQNPPPKAPPPPSPSTTFNVQDRPWREVLAVPVHFPAHEASIMERYRALSKLIHPDVGGSTDAMRELNRARDQAMAEAIKFSEAG